MNGVVDTCNDRMRKRNASEEMYAALKDVLEHVEDADAPRVGSQCTLCFTYRNVIRAALDKADGKV